MLNCLKSCTLLDEETDIIVACMTRLDNLLQDGGLPRSDGNGHP